MFHSSSYSNPRAFLHEHSGHISCRREAFQTLQQPKIKEALCLWDGRLGLRRHSCHRMLSAEQRQLRALPELHSDKCWCRGCKAGLAMVEQARRSAQQSIKKPFVSSNLQIVLDFSRVPRGSRQILTANVVPTLSRFVWSLQDFCRVPRGSRQILTRKPCSYPFPFCVVFAGLFQGAKGIPANFDPQSCSYPSSTQASTGKGAVGSHQILTQNPWSNLVRSDRPLVAGN